MCRLKTFERGLVGGKQASRISKNFFPIFVLTNLLNGGLKYRIFLDLVFFWFGIGVQGGILQGIGMS